jgi:nitrate reductase NapA
VREVGTLAHALPGGLVVANAEHRKEAEAHWNLPPGRINPKPGYHTVEMWRRFSTPTDQGGDIDTIWVQVTNPARSLPNSTSCSSRAARLPGKFLIVSDVYPTATVRLADLVLPSAMWVEKNGMVGNSERRTQQWFRMVPPPGEARDDCWQTIAVAKRLFDRGHPGLKDKDGKFLFEIVRAGAEVPIWEWAHYYDVNVDEHLFEEYRKFTRHKHKDLAPYQEYVAARGLRWPVVKQRDGSWRETKFRFSRADDPYATKAGVQFYHSVTKDDRALIWFHPYGKHRRRCPTRVPVLAVHRPRAGALAHRHDDDADPAAPPRDAAGVRRAESRRRARLGVADGEVVVVESRRGRAEVPVWIDGRGQPPPGTVFVPFFDETKHPDQSRHARRARSALSKQQAGLQEVRG